MTDRYAATRARQMPGRSRNPLPHHWTRAEKWNDGLLIEWFPRGRFGVRVVELWFDPAGFYPMVGAKWATFWKFGIRWLPNK